MREHFGDKKLHPLISANGILRLLVSIVGSRVIYNLRFEDNCVVLILSFVEALIGILDLFLLTQPLYLECRDLLH
jgi:uncharacterized protein (UPF0262 family)